ncbi:hypothetical protein POVCU1_047250 [Plasmodium ovale curtisi]|uniref:Uncharacterized protein n=1 Tax=Plasmodium ovale curtisi TaxID=864141 RepID=A0A1A8X492_PLAOA|nr:hypothetical protein POVCU1_047250 [Plasmodium ovale curtisi]
MLSLSAQGVFKDYLSYAETNNASTHAWNPVKCKQAQTGIPRKIPLYEVHSVRRQHRSRNINSQCSPHLQDMTKATSARNSDLRSDIPLPFRRFANTFERPRYSDLVILGSYLDSSIFYSTTF